ncbi:MAG: HAD family hydrolase [Candidatus Marinimicrobia bacterium]|jgi:phosphoglycolate phosphatase|nr:HAD family hydrolase [Candidatus Neomarinimicrobiota bacterium]MBT3632815.1 HAD family hydrolase [Candidatus Neomarinimicrobiota bacterium]MBT3681925.1 HAD family hydrolase [Candidatus Neomarinimicrobiota bacterium]MBT3759046.1 HAD family hydrolase [Candidatus Neomarinimicrobiota bacterium]MBT3895055.1 HAD family hydrolase [Candidatus Neomarinimicrobiota bacterium]
MKYKHIIWDWNGTLFDDAWLCVEVMNNVLSRRNMPLLTRDRYMETFDFPVKDYYRKLGFNFKSEPFEISGTEFIVGYNKRYNEPNLHSQAIPTLDAVKKLGLSQSILSAQEQNTLNELIEIHQLSSYFINILGLDNHYAHSKTENGLKWMKELHFGPHEVLFIGDTVHDYEVAEVIGADSLLIPSGHHSKAKLTSSGAKVVDSLSQVIEYI